MADRIKLTNLDTALIALGTKLKAGIEGIRGLGLDAAMELEIEVSAFVVTGLQTLASVTQTSVNAGSSESVTRPTVTTTRTESAATEITSEAAATQISSEAAATQTVTEPSTTETTTDNPGTETVARTVNATQGESGADNSIETRTYQ